MSTSQFANRLCSLRPTHETPTPTLALDCTPVADRLPADLGEPITWAVDTDVRDRAPLFVLCAATDTDDSDHLRTDAHGIVAPVPDSLLTTEPPAGLGLNLERYDPTRGVLFGVITTRGILGFVPVRYADGELFAERPLP